MDATHTWQRFLKKIMIFLNLLEESKQFFILFFKENDKCEAVFQHFWSARRQIFFERGVTQIWSLFYCKTDNLSCLNKRNCLVNSKVKEFFMCFYVIFMNKHVGITLSVFLFVLYTGARGTDHPPFPNFLFTNLFSIRFLYYFIISSLFPYFNLFVSIFIQSYANIKLHVSTL